MSPQSGRQRDVVTTAHHNQQHEIYTAGLKSPLSSNNNNNNNNWDVKGNCLGSIGSKHAKRLFSLVTQQQVECALLSLYLSLAARCSTCVFKCVYTGEQARPTKPYAQKRCGPSLDGLDSHPCLIGI